jgi:hypothetical protein
VDGQAVVVGAHTVRVRPERDGLAVDDIYVLALNRFAQGNSSGMPIVLPSER